MRFAASAIAAAGALTAVAATGGGIPPVRSSVPDSIFLTVAYCPSAFSGKGAVVKIDGTTFEPEVVAKFDYPSGIDGDCPVEEDANFYSDTVVGTRRTHLSFGSEFGLLTAVDVDHGKMQHFAKGSSGDEFLFDGFTSFALDDDGKNLRGLTPHVTEDGFCDDGCFRFGTQNVELGVFRGLDNDGLPFKAVSTNTAFFDREALTFHAQGSYPLTPEAECGEDETKQCMFTINATTGSLISSKPADRFEVYHFADFHRTVDSDGKLLGWGNHQSCGKGLDSFGFARVDPVTGEDTLVSCINQTDATVHTTPDMSAFSSDGSRFAAGSGNPETGEMQLLVFDVATGHKMYESKLPGLKKQLGVSEETPFIMLWGLSHLPPPSKSLHTKKF